jgi:hypothetical protein
MVNDLPSEGSSRNNAAATLIRLGRLTEARAELTRALQCIEGLGPNAEPWKSLIILHQLESAVGNREAATDARRCAMVEYEKARREGWQITAGVGSRLCQHVGLIVMAKVIAEPNERIPEELLRRLPQLEDGLRRQLEGFATKPDVPRYLQALAPKLLAVLDGARDPAMADDPSLDYDDAVELKLLLEQFGD